MAKKATVRPLQRQQERAVFQFHVVEGVHDADGQIQQDRKSIKKVVAPAPRIVVGADFNQFEETFPPLFPYRVIHLKASGVIRFA